MFEEKDEGLGFAEAEGGLIGRGSAVAGEVGGEYRVAGLAEGVDPGAEGGLAGGVCVGVEE